MKNLLCLWSIKFGGSFIHSSCVHFSWERLFSWKKCLGFSTLNWKYVASEVNSDLLISGTVKADNLLYHHLCFIILYLVLRWSIIYVSSFHFNFNLDGFKLIQSFSESIQEYHLLGSLCFYIISILTVSRRKFTCEICKRDFDISVIWIIIFIALQNESERIHHWNNTDWVFVLWFQSHPQSMNISGLSENMNGVL